MPTYSEWLSSTTALYAAGMTSAYDNRDNIDTTNPYYLAWQTIISTSDLNTIRPDLGSTAFYGVTPTASESDILLFQSWLQSNPVTAGQMGLEPTLTFRAGGRGELGGGGLVGTGESAQQRRWKGSPVYTFSNGILVGKDEQIVAAIGTEGGLDLDGFGTDTIAYFDGIPFATGTSVPGSVVFRGDTVVSGSIRGTGGVVIIEDVIQLERDVENPAGIGVDKDGKIRLRHRGEGFVDLIDEINNVQANVDSATDTAANIAKLWMGVQNTSSARWGTSLIPNSNFSLLSVDSGDYSERPAGVISVGTTSNILSVPETGVGRFTTTGGKGICFQAVPISSSRYAFRIRYRGSEESLPTEDASQQGLFISFHETTDSLETIGDSSFIFDNSTPASTHETTDVHSSNVTVVYPNGSTTDYQGTVDGVSIQASYQVKSFTYEPSGGATAASLVIWTKNYPGTYIDIDYVVLTENPISLLEVQNEINDAVTAIDLETDESLVNDPQMADVTQWASYDGSILSNSTDGITGGDEAITVDCTGLTSGGGIISSQVSCESGQYTIGAKVRVLSSNSGTPNISLLVIENPSTSPPPFGGAPQTPLLKPHVSNNYVGKNVDIVQLDSAGDPTGTAGASQSIGVAQLSNGEPYYTTIVGTYEATLKYQGTVDGTIYTSFDRDIPMVPLLPSSFSVVIKSDRDCIFSVDYVYTRIQSTSANIAQELADSAYVDAQAFVTEINELLIKESGSIVPNASMATLGTDGNPVGWRANGTLTYLSTGDGAIQVSKASGIRSLITPSFGLGTADKFSIGIRIKGINGAITPTVSVCTTSELLVPSGMVTIADQTYGNSDVWVPSPTPLKTGLTIDPTSTTGTDYASILATWDRTNLAEQTFLGGLASIIIEASDNFEVDYVFVKEQTVSFDLADNQALERKAEAISAAAGFVGDLSDSLAEEVGSMITNAGFTSWYTEDDGNGTPKQRPQKWLRTRDAGFPYRVLETTEVVDNTGQMTQSDITAIQAKETVLGSSIGMQGSAMRFNPGNSGGILSAKWQLPIVDTTAVTAGTATTGVYTIAVRLKVASLQTIGVRIYAHEYYSYVDSGQTHVFCSDGSYGSPTIEGEDRTSSPLNTLKLFSEAGAEGQINRIPIINVSNPGDTTPGYDPNYTNDGVDNDYADAGDDRYVEYIPIDNTSADGDPGAATGNENLWYDIAGTYKPSANAKYVSFEILIDGDPDGGFVVPDVYVDYVSFIVQPFDSDFAETLADARIESLTGIGSSDWSTYLGANGNTTLAALLLSHNQRIYDAEVALQAEDPTTTLIPNSFFGEETSGSPDRWMPTRNTDGTIVLETNAANQAAAGSYGSYITLGGTDSSRGILSEAIPILGDTGLVPGGLLTNPNFDLAIRYKASTVRTVTIPSITSDEFQLVLPAGDYSSSYPTYSDGVLEITTGVLPAGVDSTQEWNVGGITHYAEFSLPAYSSSVYVVFYLREQSEEDDPDLEFYNSEGALLSIDGEVSLWDSTGSFRAESLGSFTSQNKITSWVSSGSEISDSSSPDEQGWVIVRIDTSGVAKVKFQGTGSVDTAVDLFYMSYPHIIVPDAAESINFQMIAHEYYDTNGTFDSTTPQFVFSNGASYTHPSSFSNVVRFNTPTQGAVTAIQGLLNDGVDTNPETFEITTNSEWNMLVGLYKPFDEDNLPRYVSFEFLIEHDQDNDGIVPEVYIDGIFLQASSETPLLTAVKQTAESAQIAAGNAQQAADDAQTDATQALLDAGDANAAIVVQQGTINQHTTSIANIELAQDELVIVSTSISGETGSLIPNADFITTRADTQATPAGFYPTAYTGTLIRVQNELDTGVTFTNSDGKTDGGNRIVVSTSSIYHDVGQSSTAIAILGRNDFAPYSRGFYTGAIPLPSGQTFSYTNPSDGSTVSTTDKGVYSVAVKVKPAGSQPISVAIIANEYDTSTSPATNGTYIYIRSSNAPINALTTVDSKISGTVSGWEGSTTPVEADRSIPLTITRLSETDTTSGTWEAPVAANRWTTVGGSYTPSSTAKCVSFTIIVSFDTNDGTIDVTAESTPQTAGGPLLGVTLSAASYYAMAYVDYITVTPATFSAQLAEDIAAGAAYDVQQALEADLLTLEDNIGAESDSLMPNGNFQQLYTNSSTEYIKGWMYTRALTGSGIIPAAAANGSIGTYVNLALPSNTNSNTLGGGIISKSVEGLYTQALQEGGTVGSYNIGIRCRGVQGPIGTTLVEINSVGTTDVNTYKQYYLNSSNSGTYQHLYTSYLSGYTGTGTSSSYSDPAEAYDVQTSAYRGLNIQKLLDSFYSRYVSFNPPSASESRTLTLTLPFTPTSNLVHIYFSMRTNANWINLHTSTWRVSTHNASGNDINYGTLSVSVVDSYTSNQAVDWTQKASVNAFRTNYFTLPSGFKSNDNNWVRITIDAGSNAAANSLQYLNKIKITNETYGSAITTNTHFYCSNFQIVEVFEPADHSFTVQILAHEYTGTATSGTIYHDNNITVPSPHSENVSVISSSNVSIVPLNIIDLRYSESSPSTEITISSKDQDTGELITDWRSIVGSYQPSSANVTATAFEIKFEGDPDFDTNYQTVHLDSVTMSASSLNEDLASSISDNRIFVEQNFLGGGSVVSPNSVIFNGDFAIASKLFSNSSVLYPAGWFPLYANESAYERDVGINDETIWGYSSNSTTSNRIMRWIPLRVNPGQVDTNNDGTINSSDAWSGLIGTNSRPFKPTSNRYYLKMSYRVNGTGSSSDDVNALIYMYLTYSAQEIATDVVSILGSSDYTIRPSSKITVLSNGSVVSSGVNTQVLGYAQVGYYGGTTYDPSGNGDPFNRVQVMEMYWNVPPPTDDKDPIKWCCLQNLVIVAGDENLQLVDFEIIDIQLIPIGTPYGSGIMEIPDIENPTFDSQKDPSAPIPRETSEKEPLYKGTDIQIVETPGGYTSGVRTYNYPKGRLLAATPRKIYTSTSGTTVDTSKGDSGVSYFYPGPIPFTFKQSEYTNVSDGSKYVGSSLDLEIGALTGVSYIDFDNPSSITNYPLGSDQHDRAIQGIGRIQFDTSYEPTGILGASDNADTNGIGPHIVGVKRIYLGSSWDTTNSTYVTTELQPTYGQNKNTNLAIKQSNPPYAISIINNNGDDRWYIGEESSNLTFQKGATATSSPVEVMTISTNGLLELFSPTNTGDGVAEGGIDLYCNGNTSTSTRWKIYNKDEGSYHRLFFYYGGFGGTAGDKAWLGSTNTGAQLAHQFTGQHRSISEDVDIASDIGLIVVSTGRYNTRGLFNDQIQVSINDSHPIVKLSSKRNQKSCFGVISNKEEMVNGQIEYINGPFGFFADKLDDDQERIIINSLGEGAIWVCNINGNLENGDYITTCEIPGHGMRQDDDLLHNYTVAKITQDCNFELDNPYYDCVEFEFEGQTYRKAFVGCTYHCG